MLFVEQAWLTGSVNHPRVDGVAPLVEDPSLFNFNTSVQHPANPVKSCKGGKGRAFRPSCCIHHANYYV